MTALLVLAGFLLPGAPNPVLPKTNDIGVMRHAGEYFLMGMGTAGGVFTSDDLVRWSGPHHAFSMDNAWTDGPAATDDNIHACDLVCLNGVFHLYWSVNHGEVPGGWPDARVGLRAGKDACTVDSADMFELPRAETLAGKETP